MYSIKGTFLLTMIGKHSANHALGSITESTEESIDNGKFICGTRLNHRKAFDTVSHKIPLEKLQHNSMKETAINQLQSYLTDRMLFVVKNGGVLHGSVWIHCHFLFLLMICQQSVKFSISTLLQMTQICSLDLNLITYILENS